MKTWIWVPLAALVGLVAGSWGPREDLKAFKARTQTAKADRKTSETVGFGVFTKMVNIPDVAKKPHRARPVAEAPASAVATNAQPAASAAAAEEEPHRHRLSPDDLRARIDEAEELWRTRVELAKTQWKDKLGIVGEKESAAFEAAFTGMNETLFDTMSALADEIDRVGKLTPELVLRMMGDAATAMAGAYDALAAAVPADRRAEISEVPVFEFIDPAVAEPLVKVQDKIEAGLGEEGK